jgi:hypothetical protein
MEQPTGERLVVTLLNLPRAKLDLIAFTGKDGQRDFALRKMIWTGVGGETSAKGYEIKLDLAVSRTLRTALKAELDAIDEAARPPGPEAVRSA